MLLVAVVVVRVGVEWGQRNRAPDGAARDLNNKLVRHEPTQVNRKNP